MSKETLRELSEACIEKRAQFDAIKSEVVALGRNKSQIEQELSKIGDPTKRHSQFHWAKEGGGQAAAFQRRKRLLAAMRETQNKINELKDQLRIVNSEEQELFSKKKLAEVDIGFSIAEIVSKASAINTTSNIAVHSSDSESDFYDKARGLRRKWQDFTADSTRMNSMRLIAAEFVKDLSSMLGEKKS